MSRESHRNGDCGPYCQICVYEDEREEAERASLARDDYWWNQRLSDAAFAEAEREADE